jgi:hypothetical protein
MFGGLLRFYSKPTKEKFHMSLSTQSLITKSRWLAIILFAGMVVIILLFFLTQFRIEILMALVLLGYCYVAFAALSTIGVFVMLLVRAYTDSINRGKILTTCLLLLLNIPAMFAYCWFTILLFRSMA